MKIPQSPSEITAEWLNNLLFPKISNNKIISIEIDKNFGPWSLLGKAVRIKIEYAMPGVADKPDFAAAAVGGAIVSEAGNIESNYDLGAGNFS